MVICAAISCGSNSTTSKELNINLYQLPWEETLKIACKQKLWQEKLPADKNIRVCNLHFEEECFEEYEITDAIKNIVKELVLNVENQFLDHAFTRDSVFSNTSKSEFETEYGTEYKPDSSSKLDQSTCQSYDQFSEQVHLEEQLLSNNSAFGHR